MASTACRGPRDRLVHVGTVAVTASTVLGTLAHEESKALPELLQRSQGLPDQLALRVLPQPSQVLRARKGFRGLRGT
jgi:hypothetical protein